jgi:SagB-type dehydrogenase family enzyme
MQPGCFSARLEPGRLVGLVGYCELAYGKSEGETAMYWTTFLTILAALAAAMALAEGPAGAEARLPAPDRKGKMTLEAALAARRSVRSYDPGELTEEQISQLCWAAAGITEPKRGFRTAPSAGALYPLEIYLVTARGVFRYEPRGHVLKPHLNGDLRKKLQAAALNQGFVGAVPVCFVIAAAEKRSAVRYGRRAWRYCLLEAGHVAQNIHLQAAAMSLASVPVGAFEDDRVSEAVRLPADQRPVYLIPVGRPKSPGKGP